MKNYKKRKENYKYFFNLLKKQDYLATMKRNRKLQRKLIKMKTEIKGKHSEI